MATWTIAKRELQSLFVSPIAYIILGLFSLLISVQFLNSWTRFDQALQQAQIQAQMMKNPDMLSQFNLNTMLVMNVASFTFFILLFAVPFITMRFITEERTRGTYELLLTSPLSTWSITLGKFIAGMLFLLCILATQCILLGAMFIFGNPEPGQVFSAYLGVFLAGSTFLAIGLFASAITKNQIIAAFLAMFINLLFLFSSWIANAASGNLSLFLKQASFVPYFEEFNKGIISLSSLVYFVTLWIFFLAGTKLSLETLRKN